MRTALVSLVGLLLLVGRAAAAPAPDSSPLRIWSVNKVEQGVGQDVALDGAGRIVAAGYAADGPDTEFALMRAKP
jgi:hypothetical protein